MVGSEPAEKLAANGYVTLAVDLYRANRSCRRPRFLADRPDVDPKHIGSLGWSMGGGLAVQLAIHEPRLAACVVNYGPLPTNTGDIQKIDVPVLGNFGALNRGIPVDKVRSFRKMDRSATFSIGQIDRLREFGGGGLTKAVPA